MHRMIALTAAALLAVGAAHVQAQEKSMSQGEAAVIEVAEAPQFGSYLTDAEGRALYMFTADKGGKSACKDDCAKAWPPLVSNGQPKLGEGIDESKVGTIQRSDGGAQVTFAGYPLYYFAKDTMSGQITGQDKKGFGGEWYILSPKGEPIHGEQKAEGKKD